ncbi:MAG: archease [Acidobacteria bacterium]|nr:archease [Acidobacteriota bacterium]MBI3658691.1 archease [Acidobacteriota bacterium]
MNKPRYEALDHTADARVRVSGDSMEALFANAAFALFDTMADLGCVQTRQRLSLHVSADNRERLLHAWLSELLFLFATQHLLLSEFCIRSLTPTRLEAEVGGEPLDLGRHTFYTEVKAVTFHQLRVECREGEWIAEIIFDI